jgi:hypothetical protein
MDSSRLTESLNNHFDPEIHVELFKYLLDDKVYGLIYVFPVNQKPVICKKTEGSNLRESAIYYRYRGQSREVKYSELRSMIELEKEKTNNKNHKKNKKIKPHTNPPTKKKKLIARD